MFKAVLKLLSHSLSLSLVCTATAHAAPVQWTVAAGGNDHWYEFIPASVTWDAARAAALASSHLGLTGYLATILSSAENTFAANATGGSLAWLGATDTATEGTWVWRDGPEAGQTTVYTNWEPGEPNDVNGGEDYLHFNFSSFGGWNDHGGPGGNADQANGYLIEYSGTPVAGVPEPISLALVLPALLAAGWASRRRQA